MGMRKQSNSLDMIELDRSGRSKLNLSPIQYRTKKIKSVKYKKNQIKKAIIKRSSDGRISAISILKPVRESSTKALSIKNKSKNSLKRFQMPVMPFEPAPTL